MKCYIRRCGLDQENKRIWKDSYINPIEFYDKSKREWDYYFHWVCDKQEAKQFNTIEEAKWFIKTYNLKNCDVYKKY